MAENGMTVENWTFDFDSDFALWIASLPRLSV